MAMLDGRPKYVTAFGATNSKDDWRQKKYEAGIIMDVDSGKYEVIKKFNGYVRGMDKIGDYLFVCMSKLRKSHTFNDSEYAKRRDYQAGFEMIHLPTGATISHLKFHRSCDEIYDICVLPGLKRPGMIGVMDGNYRMALTLPDAVFWSSTPERQDV